MVEENFPNQIINRTEKQNWLNKPIVNNQWRINLDKIRKTNGWMEKKDYILLTNPDMELRNGTKNYQQQHRRRQLVSDTEVYSPTDTISISANTEIGHLEIFCFIFDNLILLSCYFVLYFFFN